MYCERMRFHTGAHTCSVCLDRSACSNRLDIDKNGEKTYVSDRQLHRLNKRSQAVHARREALNILERDLQRTELHAPTGFPLHSDSEWEEDVSSSGGLCVAEEQGEKEELTGLGAQL